MNPFATPIATPNYFRRTTMRNVMGNMLTLFYYLACRCNVAICRSSAAERAKTAFSVAARRRLSLSIATPIATLPEVQR